MKNRTINWNLLIGIGVGMAIIAFAAFHVSTNAWIFLNIAGAMIVFGGLTGAAFMMYPMHELKDLMRYVGYCFANPPQSLVGAASELIQLAQMQQKDPLTLTREIGWVKHYTIRDGVGFLAMGLRGDEIRKRMDLLAEQKYERQLGHAGFLLSLAKLGPGFGLLGTIFGLVVMLEDMGAGSGFEKVGPSLAVALLATLYGVIAANVLFQPFSELMRLRADHNRKLDSMIAEGLHYIKEKRHPLELREVLKNYFNWEQLNEFESLSQSDPVAPAEEASYAA